MIGQRMLLAFHGKDRPSLEIIDAFKNYQPAGITLFRSLNVGSAAQLRRLTDSLQRLAHDFGMTPLLVAADQEGGQLMAVGDGTPLPGNMALGATGSVELSRQAGEVLGRELSALGINVDYAPCVDVNINPKNPVVGIRSFGEDPEIVARLGAALIEGIQSQGVAATAKHFPGHGDTQSDSHRGLPTVSHSLERLRAVEFIPFISAIEAGAKLIMSAHIGLTAIDGPNPPPATLSPTILKNILRRDLNFAGVIVTDAMDMGAISQGEGLGRDSIRAVFAGADLLLITSSPSDQAVVYASLMKAAKDGTLPREEMNSSVERIMRLKRWLADNLTKTDINVINCTEHRRVADEIAARSVTLVRNHENLLPLRLPSGQKVAIVFPQPVDLTPADTSSYVTPSLTSAIRKYHPEVDEFLIPFTPSGNGIAGLLQKLLEYKLIVLCTMNAYGNQEQTNLVRRILKINIPTVVAALRLPYDLAAFPEARTYVCTYSILEPSMSALASALFGFTKFTGRLPVSIPGLYQIGHGESL
jgi:beta-N-acetylhexosaminidase